MDSRGIIKFISLLEKTKDRNIIIIDFANVYRWHDSLGWAVGIRQLGLLVKHFAVGKKYLRRFYYGLDFGSNDKSTRLTQWSSTIHSQAQMGGFEIVSKRVKYIYDSGYESGFVQKCNLDIEMAVDLIAEQANYDRAIIFSGDGDLAYVFNYLNQKLGKEIYVFGARNHIGKELIDSHTQGIVKDLLFAEDFQTRLDLRL